MTKEINVMDDDTDDWEILPMPDNVETNSIKRDFMCKCIPAFLPV